MILSFLAFYQWTNGGIVWLYSSEVACDTALSIGMLMLWGTILLLSLTTNYLMQSALNPWGVFWLLGGISICGAFFAFFCIKETAGLTDR